MGSRYQRHASVEAAALDDGAILFHPESTRFYLLNRSSAFLWSRLSDPMTADHLAEEMCQAFEGVGLDDALRDVHDTLQQMVSMKLILVEGDGLSSS